jgi:gamma-D-glutamyl-L-lysine dipeptidyl-peptidase
MPKINRDKFIRVAKTHLGKPYVFGQGTDFAMDCVNFLRIVGREFNMEIEFPEYYTEADFRILENLDKYFERTGELKLGNILAINNGLGLVHHVAFYAGNGMVIHCTDASSKPGVRLDAFKFFEPKISYIYDISTFKRKLER